MQSTTRSSRNESKTTCAKRTKEAKVATSWINPTQVYDEALQKFVGQALDDCRVRDDFQRLLVEVAQAGMINSLAQTVLK